MNRDRIVAGLTLLATASMLVAGPADCPDEHQRAGHPQEVSRFAFPSDTGRYLGHLVGGGCVRPHKAEPLAPDEGTWGWDFTGGCFRRCVDLGWWHGRRCQGGTGAYATDGPKLRHE